jgi:competence protein ComGF
MYNTRDIIIQNKISNEYLNNSIGFTLLEVIIAVTVLFTVLIPAYPIINNQYQSILLKQEVNKLATYIETARQEIILEKESKDIRFLRSEFPHSYRIRKNNKIIDTVFLPESIKLYTNIEENVLVFNNLGIPKIGGTIRLTNINEQYQEIIIHPFSGIIEIR